MAFVLRHKCVCFLIIVALCDIIYLWTSLILVDNTSLQLATEIAFTKVRNWNIVRLLHNYELKRYRMLCDASYVISAPNLFINFCGEGRGRWEVLLKLRNSDKSGARIETHMPIKDSVL